MTIDEILEWEERQLEEHDLADLADCVQLLRTLAWTASFALDPPLPTDRAFIWFEDLEDFPATIELLRDRAKADSTAEGRLLCSTLSRLYLAAHDALDAGPRRPNADEVIRRYVNGEIGDRTVRYVMGWGPHQLVEECLRRGQPPIQVGGDENRGRD